MTSNQWHTLDIEETAKRLETSLTEGLSSAQAKERLKQFGPNELESKGRKSILSMLLEQLSDFMVIILIAAAVISGLRGELTDAVIILLVVIINAVLGVIQENKAENALAALKKIAAPHAKVKRDGTIDVIPASGLVPGDLVVLETGDFVPADLRLIESSNLKIQEAALTGESVPVEKDTAALEDVEIPLGDRVNMAYTSSLVTYGRGSGIVVGTGMNTEIGKIAEMIQTEEEMKTPLQKKLEALGKTLAIAALAACAVIFLVGILYGKEIHRMFLTSVSLAVAVIPEGLPAIVTIVLAIGVQRMAARNAIIRKLPSVETLGSATVICSDKTGTLTQNRMTVEKVYVDGRLVGLQELAGYDEQPRNIELLVTIGALCNDTKVRNENGKTVLVGDPTETALVDLGLKLKLSKESLEQRFPRVDEIPFDSDRKLMTTIHSCDTGYRALTKGAPDELLKRCDRILHNGQVMELTQEIRDEILKANTDMASSALRVLGMAYKHMPSDTSPAAARNEAEKGLVFTGLVGMIDPPREEAKEAVRLCKRAGIKPVMITGDHKVTAAAIARQLGMLEAEDEIMTGSELDNISDEELTQNIMRYSVYARVSPEHKVRIVKAWQAHDEIVAMTGDGVNDAPALKRANIGAAMGVVGTDVAKEASDMVLTDDNFATVVAAVEEGRVIFSNILKSIQFLLSCNVGEILVLFIATMFNWEEPLLPIHILWVNLVTDSLPALALGVDPPEEGIMDRKPRSPKGRVFDKGMVSRIIYQGLMIGALTLAAFWLGHNGSSAAGLGREEGIAAGRTMAFAVLALSQLVHAFNVRSNRYSIFKAGLFGNRSLVGAAALSTALQLGVILIPPLARVFKVASLSAGEWITVLVLSLAPIPIVELAKALGLNTAGDEAREKQH